MLTGTLGEALGVPIRKSFDYDKISGSISALMFSDLVPRTSNIVLAGLGTRVWHATCPRRAPSVPNMGSNMQPGVPALIWCKWLAVWSKCVSLQSSLSNPIHQLM